MAVKRTTHLLANLRALMKDTSCVENIVHAYIVPSGDAHLSEYIAACDERRAYISGFTGSAGKAVITDDKAVLWTDGRYYLQASNQLDDNWLLMKEGLPETPSLSQWLISEFPEGGGGRVGVDPTLLSEGEYEDLQKAIVAHQHSVVPVTKNLIDIIWGQDRPPRPLNPIFFQAIEYAGKSATEKVLEVRAEMTKRNAVVLVVTALDEIAWLLNLRGNDISYNPVFFSYALLTDNSFILCIDEKKLSDEIKAYMHSSSINIVIRPYESILSELTDLIYIRYPFGKIWVSEKTNYALSSAVPQGRRIKEQNPISLMKCIKNEVEMMGMKNAHIKDAVALCQLFNWLQNAVTHERVTELDVSRKSEEFRSKQENYVSLSFATISAFGSNGAIIHYKPSETTNKVITTKELFLLDSGAQFRDGTTDVTRTVHFGQPTDHEKECYTLVLKGHIALSTAIFPNGVKGYMLDSLARQALWNNGLDYLHGTGHGVGSFLNVHEGPVNISTSSGKVQPDEKPLKRGMILSNEPGFYQDGDFGIRLENVVAVVDCKTKNNFAD